MRIGSDFDKIEFSVFGLDLLEPNAFVGDIMISILSLSFYLAIHRWSVHSNFIIYWRRFFLWFGLCYGLGSLGHLFYNYWAMAGKLPALFLSLLSPFFIEQAMLSIYRDDVWRVRLKRLSLYKLLLSLASFTLVCAYVDMASDPFKGLIVITISSLIGLIFSLGYLGYRYAEKYSSGFKYFWISVLVLLPSVFFQAFKINFLPWFDRNDVSHLMMLLALLLFYKGVKAYAHSEKA